MKTKQKNRNQDGNLRRKIAKCPECGNEYSNKTFNVSKTLVKCPLCDVEMILSASDMDKVFQKANLR